MRRRCPAGFQLWGVPPFIPFGSRMTTSRKTPWGLVSLLGALTAMGALAIDMYLPSLPAIGVDLHASPAETQSTLAAFLVGLAFGQLLFGPASDRLGRKPAILCGVAIYVLASAGCALATSAGWLIAMRLVQALGACAGGVVSRAVVRDRFDHVETARTLSLMMLIMGLAPIFAPSIGGLLMLVGTWRDLFWIMAAFGVLLGAAVLFGLSESRSAETAAHAAHEHPMKTYLVLLGDPRVLGFALASALNGALLFTYISASPVLLIQHYGISPRAFGLVFGVNGFGIIGANQVNRRLLRRWTPEQVLARARLACVAAAAVLALIAATRWGGVVALLSALFVVLASFGFLQGNAMAGALAVSPKRAGSISALLGGLSAAAGAGAAWASGALQDGTALPMALLMLAAAMGSAAALRMLAFRDSPAHDARRYGQGR